LIRIHTLEHDDWNFDRTNITRWADHKGYRLASTYVFTAKPLPKLDEFDWLMVMGGSQHAWEEDINPWLAPEKEYVKEALAAGKVVIGICFGAQVLAEALGGNLFTNGQREVGWYEVGLNEDGRRSFLFRNLPERFVTFHWHSDHYSLPPNCLRLASSPPTENQVFVKPGQPVVGIQFHPEYTRRMVLEFAQIFGREEWDPDTYVAGADAVIARTPEIPDTYWLMESLLNNIEREFA
jgi:GMP synthase-like glutamine amidotransferase